MMSRDLERTTIFPVEGLLRCVVGPKIVSKPGVEVRWARDLGGVTPVLDSDGSQVGEHPYKRFRVVPVQSRNLSIKSTAEQIESHKRDSAGSVTVRGRDFVPRGEIIVIQGSLNLSSRGDPVHQIVEADIPMTDSVDPETVVT